MVSDVSVHDLAIVGGGINGAGIARDAAGRGLSVVLLEQADLASATSSASSKLIHGGLRYLEHYEFRLVAEALAERETLIGIAPHIIRPLTFVLPRVASMRPRWMLRAGLWLYDHLARRSVLPGASTVRLAASPFGSGLRPGITDGFTYSDCRADDARLVVLNCMSAAEHGASINTHTRVVSALADTDHWRIDVQSRAGMHSRVRAKAVVNAAGPWVRNLLMKGFGRRPDHGICLVKGSHIVTTPLYDGDHAFILQNDDGRVILVIPFEGRYSLIGTTDIPHRGEPEEAVISAEEIAYLCTAVNRYFARNISSSDVLWSFSGVRPLYDDGAANPSEVTRDYRLLVDATAGPPLLSIYGGKITTYRRLAEHALQKLQPWFPGMPRAWTASHALPGGDLPQGPATLAQNLRARHPRLPAGMLAALAFRHGSNADEIIGSARLPDDLGPHFGHHLYGREVDWFMDREWARTADDVLWRRTKAGLELDDNAQHALARYMAARASRSAAARIAGSEPRP